MFCFSITILIHHNCLNKEGDHCQESSWTIKKKAKQRKNSAKTVQLDPKRNIIKDMLRGFFLLC